jgi:phytanoyl-CoA hydroxylase
MITDGQVAFYRENGYLVVHDLFTPAEMERMRQACDEAVERTRSITANDADYELEPGHGPADLRVRRLRRPMKNDSRFAEVARDPKVLDIIARLIGPDIRLSHPNGKLNMKQAGIGAPIEWHQDWVGYPHTNEDLCAIGIPLDDVDLENGPMMVIPGSHKGPVYSHHDEDGTYVAGIDPVKSGIDFSKAVPLTGKAGLMTIHHVRTVHGSATNTSARSRRLFLVQYAAVDAWPLFGVPNIDEFNAAILRGKPTLEPRMETLPVLLPTGSGVPHMLYEAQAKMEHHFFAPPPARKAATA